MAHYVCPSSSSTAPSAAPQGRLLKYRIEPCRITRENPNASFQPSDLGGPHRHQAPAIVCGVSRRLWMLHATRSCPSVPSYAKAWMTAPQACVVLPQACSVLQHGRRLLDETNTQPPSIPPAGGGLEGPNSRRKSRGSFCGTLPSPPPQSTCNRTRDPPCCTPWRPSVGITGARAPMPVSRPHPLRIQLGTAKGFLHPTVGRLGARRPCGGTRTNEFHTHPKHSTHRLGPATSTAKR